MKKLISVLLSVIMIFSLVTVGVSAAGDELIITVANDLQFNLEASTAAQGSYTDADYSHIPVSGQLMVESEIIVDTFLQAAAENESEIVLLPGDLVEAGSAEEHAIIVSKLAAFEKTSGKAVYVVPGNHDYYGDVGVAEFPAVYSEFGYGEAIAADTLSASYVAELKGDYRLLAIDSCNPGKSGHGITAERVEWIKAQAEKAQADGKKVIAMMHHNLLNHFVFGDILHKGAVIDESYGLEEIFTKYNVKYNFVAHTHDHDIASYTGSNGKTFYDIVTSTINSYPCPYRVVTFGDEVKIETRTIDSIDASSLKGVISDVCYELAASDFKEYARQCAWVGVSEAAENYVTPSRLKSLLGLDAETDAEMCALVDELAPVIKEAVYLPMYQADETEAGKSIEALAAKLNLTLPETDIKSSVDLALFFYEEHVLGDENYGLLSKEFTLLTAALTTIINYVLKDVTAEQYADALNYLCEYLKVPVTANFLSYSSDGLSRTKGIDLFVSSVANTLILHFTTDEAPADNNVVLPGYGEMSGDEAELSFWDKIVNFFKSAIDYILRIFGIGK